MTEKIGLFSNVLEFLNNEQIDFELKKVSDSEFWLEKSDGSVTVKLKINHVAHEIWYDVYSTEYNRHLKEETIRDVEALEWIAEEQGKWSTAKAVEDIWLVLDEIRYWAQKNEFIVKENEII